MYMHLKPAHAMVEGRQSLKALDIEKQRIYTFKASPQEVPVSRVGA